MSTSEANLQSEQDLHQSSTVRKINSLFNSSKTRHDGWQLLNSYLPQCPEEDFLQFCVSWMQNCCKTDDLRKNKDCAINLLNNLFKISSNYQELKKSVSFFITSQYFDFFLKYFLNSPAGWNCTKNCLLLYKGACGTFHDNLQKQLKNEVDKNKKISVIAAECYALLPCTGGGGNDGVNYKRNWTNQFMKILSICHSVLNDLFVDAEELKEYETLEYTYKKVDGDKNTDYLVNQLYNYTIILNCMLLNQYPAPKSIPSDLIFQLICRGLTLNPKSLARRQTTEYMALQKVLPDVQCIFLSLLKAVIVTCKNMLTPYSHLICKLIKQTLEWTEMDSGCEEDKSFLKLRISAYETLCNWLAASGNGSCIEVVSNVVISSAAKDITSKKEVVSLKGKSPNKNRQTTTRRVETAADGKLCYAALKSLQFLLKFAGVSLQPEEHKFLQEMVVKLLLEVQKSSSVDVKAPFFVPECRKELYSLLLELVHQPCTKWPPPTHFALRLFCKGVNDRSPEVSSFCSAGVNLTTIIIHPQHDNGGFSAGEVTVNDSFAETEIPWTEELRDVQDEKVVHETPEEKIVENNESSDSVKTDSGEKLSDPSEDVGASSGEDSKATVTYSRELEPFEEKLNGEEVIEIIEVMEVSLKEDEPSPKKQKMSTEEPTSREAPTPMKEKVPETPPTTRDHKKNSSDKSEDGESAQDSPNEPTHPKKRYFLRSKTKGSSEEPEEGQKSASSPESVKSTPMKGVVRSTPVAHSSHRPKTRALSRIETSSEVETKANEKSGPDNEDVDEENLKAAFDDSLVD